MTGLDVEAAAARIRAASRIHIVGGPGTGKSSLARALEASGGRVIHHLDETAYEGADFSPRPYEVTLAAARAIAREPRWITEGIFVAWVDPLFDEADVIVWLDHVSWGRAARRVAIRWARQALRELTVRRGRERFFRFGDYARNIRHLVRVLVTSREYWSDSATATRYTVTRTQIDRALAPHAAKVVHVTGDDEAEAISRLVGPTS